MTLDYSPLPSVPPPGRAERGGDNQEPTTAQRRSDIPHSAMMQAAAARVCKLVLAATVATVTIHLVLRRRHANRLLLRCSQCGLRQPASGFTLKQARRSEKKRKCLACVEMYDRNPPPSRPPKPSAAVSPVPAAPAATATAAAPATAATAATEDVSRDQPEDPLRVARKAETVLRGRTERVLLVLEGCADDLNHLVRFARACCMHLDLCACIMRHGVEASG